MTHTLIIGGGHGTQALSLIPDQKIYFGTWDDGGSSGFLRSLFPDALPFGDLRSVLAFTLQKEGRIKEAQLLSLRSANITELHKRYKDLEKLLGTSHVSGFSDFLTEYYELKLRHLLEYKLVRVPEDNLGNIIFLYLYIQGGLQAIFSWIHDQLKCDVSFGFLYEIPVFLYGYYFDTQYNRYKVLDSESLIDTSHSRIVRFVVRDAESKKPPLSKELMMDIRRSKGIILAPGSPENYLPLFTSAGSEYINVHDKSVILVAQLFTTSKDQYLSNQIISLAKKVDNFVVWVVDENSVKKILSHTNLLLSYAVENKVFDVFFIAKYRRILYRYLQKWLKNSHTNELYRLLYSIYVERYNAHYPEVEEYVHPCVAIIEEADGWKHDQISLLSAYQSHHW